MRRTIPQITLCIVLTIFGFLFCNSGVASLWVAGGPPNSSPGPWIVRGELHLTLGLALLVLVPAVAISFRGSTRRSRWRPYLAGFLICLCVGLRNSWYAFEGTNSEDVAECLSFNDARSAYRVYGFGTGADTIFNCTSILGSQLCAYCMWAYYCFDCLYCINVHNCKDCFGCVGLRNKQYCILNRQYTREEYLELRGRIIEHMKQVPYGDPAYRTPMTEWGQWFPPQSTFFPYNISFPSSIDQWDEHHAKCAFVCERTGKLFNMVPPVIQALKRANLALLPEHPVEYLRRRLSESRFCLIPRVSAKSGAALLSAYSEDEAPIVYSNDEYREEFCSLITRKPSGSGSFLLPLTLTPPRLQGSVALVSLPMPPVEKDFLLESGSA